MNIIELGRTTSIQQRTAPTLPFIRQVVLGPYTPDAGLLADFPGLDESSRPIIVVTGIRDLEGAVYDRKMSLEDMRGEQQSFFWNQDTQTLFLHLSPSDNPIDSVYLYGIAQGFSQGRVVYIDDVKYVPLIDSAPAVRQQQDIENYDKLAFITGTISLSNNDGRLDSLRTEPVYGNDVIMYYLDDNDSVSDNYARSELTRLASLFVEDYDISLNELSLRIQDRRKSQNAALPTERFTVADYPDIEERRAGKVIPVLWGTATIPAVVTNGEVTTGNVKYRAALVLTGIGTVQAKGDDDEWVTVTPASITLASGEFELSAVDGRKSGGRARDVRLVGATGIAITRITDIIKDANERFFNVSYTTSNYDTAEWDAEEASISSGAHFVDEEVELFDLIRDLQNGSNVGWRFEINADGQRTIRVDDESRESVAFVPSIKIQNRNELEISTDSETLAAEVLIKYGFDYESEEYLRYFDDGSLQDVLEIYNQRPRKTYETILTNATDAAERAVYVRDRFDRIRGIGEFVLMGAEFLELRIYDIITIEVTPDELTQQRRPFYGTWKAKIISVAPDARQATNTITALLIEEVV